MSEDHGPMINYQVTRLRETIEALTIVVEGLAEAVKDALDFLMEGGKSSTPPDTNATKEATNGME